MRNNHQAGFIPILIVVVVAAAAAIGGGVYYNNQKDNVDADMQATSTMEANLDASADVESRGSLRALLALGGNRQCKVMASSTEGQMTGTVYMSGSMVRGDFETDLSGSGEVESSMILSQNEAYVWSGSTGTKMNSTAFTSAQANAQASASTESQVDINSVVEYSCESWSPDASKFEAPRSVNFIDVSAMLQNQGGVNIPAGVNVNGSINAGVNAY